MPRAPCLSEEKWSSSKTGQNYAQYPYKEERGGETWVRRASIWEFACSLMIQIHNSKQETEKGKHYRPTVSISMLEISARGVSTFSQPQLSIKALFSTTVMFIYPGTGLPQSAPTISKT